MTRQPRKLESATRRLPEDDWASRVAARLGTVELGERGAGRCTAADLLPLVYDHLRAVARHRIAGRGPDETLQATALVHEAWLRVAGPHDPGWDGRAHFFGAAARAMRNILVERARHRQTERAGGGRRRLPVGEIDPEIAGADLDLLSLDEALTRLETVDPARARVVMLRFYAGLTMPEIAGILGCGLTKVETDWRFARSWLQRRLADDRRHRS